MSADNFIEVRETKERTYTVREMSATGGVLEEIGGFSNLREAMCAAEDYSKETMYGVEYGIQFVPYQP